MQKIIKWGILGAGRIAQKFASDLNKTPNCKLKAVASTSLERAEKFALDNGAKWAFGCYEDLFSIDLDVIYIATPHTFHYEHTMLCLNNGVGVLCEKPFAMNEKEVSEMIKLAKIKNLFLMEAMWSRFLPAIIQVKEWIETHKIGKINRLEANFGFESVFNPQGRLFDKNLGGGAFLDVGIYPAFLSLLLLGMPKEIEAESIFTATGADGTTSFKFYFENNAIADLKCSVIEHSDCEAHIYGENGSIIIHPRFHESQKVTLHLNNHEAQDFDFSRDTIGYNYEIEEVNNCLFNNQIESKLMSHKLSLDLIQLLDKTREKAGIIY